MTRQIQSIGEKIALAELTDDIAVKACRLPVIIDLWQVGIAYFFHLLPGAEIVVVDLAEDAVIVDGCIKDGVVQREVLYFQSAVLRGKVIHIN